MTDPYDPQHQPSHTRAGTAGNQSPLLAALHRTFSSLWHRNYRLFFMGHCTSMMGAWIQRIAMGWIVWEMTGSKAWLGTIFAVAPLPILLLTWFGGLLADRFDRRHILYVTQSCAAIGPMAMAVLLWIDPEYEFVNRWYIFVLAVGHGLVMAFDIPARQAFIPRLVPRYDLPNAIALNSSLFNVSRMVGSAVGGLLYSAVGAALCFAANSLTYIALIAALLLMRLPPADKSRQRHERLSRHPLGGLFYSWTHRPIRASMVMIAAASICGWSMISQLPAFTDEVFGGGTGTYGFLLGAFGAGAFCAALVLAYLGSYPHRQRIILAGTATAVVSITVFTFQNDPRIALIPMFFAGSGLLATVAGTNSFIQMLVSERFRARVMGIYSTAFVGMMPVGFFGIGLVAEHVGLQFAVRMNMITLGVVALGVGLYWKRLQQEPSDAPLEIPQEDGQPVQSRPRFRS